MIPVLIFYLHILGGVLVFSYRYQQENIKEAFMTLAFLAVIFTVAWTIAGFLVHFFAPDQGFAPWLDNDSLSLLITTFLEAILYGVYFRDRKRTRSQPTGA